ncbi:acyltransferase family protein [Leyella stercorea]
MTQYLSDKLRVLSLISIILVLYIHSGFHADEIEGMVMNDRVQEFVSGMMGRCAVPLFYVISGYLFFLKVPEGMKSIYGKMRKRVGTLVVPYIIGCLFFVGFGVLMAVLPGVSKYMNSSLMPLFFKPIGEILRSIFYDAGNGTPCAFQLWFLRDLILIVATSPLWYLCLKHLKWGFVAVVFVLTYFDVPHVPFLSLFWFVLGGQLTKAKIEMGGDGRTKVAIFGLCLFLIISIIQLFFPDIIDWGLLRIPIILLGIIGAWGLYDVVFGKDFSLSRHQWFATACQFTFFIYLFHEPTLNIVRKLIVVVLGKNEFGYMASYLISPWIFTVCAVFAGLLFRKYLPRVYDVCTGGR